VVEEPRSESIKEVLLDPDGPRDIPLPPRGSLFGSRRRIVAFLDDPIENLLSDLPEWNFRTIEISNEIYRVTATDSLGHSVEFAGADLNDLHRRAAEAAKSIEDRCKNQD